MQYADILNLAGLRHDGRKANELRELKHNLGVGPYGDGSCYFEQGLNKVLVVVNGPCEIARNSQDYVDKGLITINISNAAFSGIERKIRRQGGDRRSQEMEGVLKSTLEGVVLLNLYPKSEISLSVHVFENDGSIICTIINACSMALMDAGISMSEMLCSCSIGLIKNRLCIDINNVEQGIGPYLSLAMKANTEEVVYLQLESRLSSELLEDAMENVIKGCRGIKKYIVDAMFSFMNEENIVEDEDNSLTKMNIDESSGRES